MKIPVCSLVLAVYAAPFAGADTVPAGATWEEVRATLGAPKGRVEMGGRELFYFDRGEIELRDGRVVRASLRTPEEQAALTEREVRRREEQEARQAGLVAEGTALRDRKLADASFLAAPVAYQVAFWENFTRSYPGVPCAEPLMIARLKLNEQLEDKARQAEQVRRIAELEERLAGAVESPVYYRSGYPVRRSGGDRYHPHHEFALWPVSYTYFDSPLPVYTTPTTPLINPFRGDPAQPERRDFKLGKVERWQRDDRGNGENRRGGEAGRGSGRERGHRGERY